MKKFLYTISILLIVVCSVWSLNIGEEVLGAGVTNTHSIDLEKDTPDWLSVADDAALDITGDISIEAWVNPESSASFPTIVAKHGGAGQRGYYLAYDDGNDKIYFNVSDDGTNNDAHVSNVVNKSNGTWYHYAVTFDASAATTIFYLNGNAVGGETQTKTAIFDNNADFAIGQLSVAGEAFDGKIDEVRVWNDIRTAGEISTNYQKQLVGNEAGLVGYWALNNDLTDETANANTLSSNGSPSFSTDIPFEGGGPCVYTGSGDWEVSESDVCYITTSVHVLGEFNLIESATGQFDCAPGVIVEATKYNFGGNTTINAACIAIY